MARPTIGRNDLIDTKEAARRLGVQPDTVRNWVRERKIPAVRLPSGQMRFRMADIEKAHATGASSPIKVAPYSPRAPAASVDEGLSGENDDEALFDLSDFPPEARENIRENVMWAYRHAYADVDFKDAPSLGAVFWLKFLRKSPGNMVKFVEVLKSQLPTPKQLEQLERFEDDGRDVLGLIDRAAADYRDFRARGGDGALELLECPKCQHQWYG